MFPLTNFQSGSMAGTVPTRAAWSDFECQGSEPTLGQCKHSLLARALYSYEEPFEVFARCADDAESKPGPTATSVDILRASPTVTLVIPRTSAQPSSPTKLLHVTTSSIEGPNTGELVPIQTSSTQEPLFTSAPNTVAPPDKCPSTRCQNGGTCEWVKNAWKCYCLGTFAGEYCEVYVGSNAVSIVLKMTLDQWKPGEFKRTLAEILTSHCRVNTCLYEIQNTKAKKQKMPHTFQPDDVIILQGYPKALPKAWQGMSLLNVRLAVKTPDDSSNTVIPHEILSQLITKVAPEVHRRLGHGIAYIDRVEVVASVAPEASGRNADEPHSATVNKYALTVLGVLLGVVCLIAIIVIVLYRRKTKREETLLTQEVFDDKPGENIRLMAL
ncbi:hypothetical protein OS493_007577 [Desmophyllum pertusum]|uniref:EGF-like domain-containing protein n=1 Tax=Desmophyllum pertusum TaxID=174260 RepID=A0A9W9Z3X2_9CNID|nr:hypothetical protein OS493_007577 [Desmophyllum pertusum]